MRISLACLVVLAVLTVSPVAAQHDRPGSPDQVASYHLGGVTFRLLKEAGEDLNRPGGPESTSRFHLGHTRTPYRGSEFVAEPGRVCEQWTWTSGGTSAMVSANRSCYQANMPSECSETDGYELSHYVDSWSLAISHVAVLYTEKVYEWDLYCKGRFIHQ